MRNIFKGLDLIDRVPDELWNEVRATEIKTIPMEKKCKKAKWLSGEALEIAVKRREVKKAERRRIDAFELWCWRRLLRVPWTASKQIQPVNPKGNQC